MFEPGCESAINCIDALKQSYEEILILYLQLNNTNKSETIKQIIQLRREIEDVYYDSFINIIKEIAEE